MVAREHVPLAPLTTLRLGGPARRLVEVETEADLVDALRDAEGRDEPVFVLGGGSNVVVADEGFAGTVLVVGMRGVTVHDGEAAGSALVVGSSARDAAWLIDVAAGEDWDGLVARAVAEGWGGIEAMSGIPGRVGGTPIQNVGAYGQEVSDTIVSVRAYDRTAGAFVTMRASACQFGYRASIFKRDPRWIVTSVRFALSGSGESAPIRYAELARALGVGEGVRASARDVRDVVIALRRGKGMVLDAQDPESVSAGSFFVNPIVTRSQWEDVQTRAGERPPAFALEGGNYKLAAAWLVERAGFAKGWTIGRVGVSRKHALALVNRGGATTRELLGAAQTIRDGVRDRFGIALEPEPVLVGCDWPGVARGEGRGACESSF